jgi:ATP-dependent Clp protease ATP-binding subunit ClpA
VRPLKRVIEERVVAPIAAWMAANPEVSGRAVRVDVERGGGITVA